MHFWYCAKKNNNNIFNHVNTDWLIISLLNTVIEKKLQLGKQKVRTNEWLGNLCKAVKTKHWPRCFSFSRSFKTKTNQNTLAMLYRKFLRKKQLSNVLSEFAIFLKLGLLWWKRKIFIANFSHVSPNRFWRIFSMLLQSHPTIKWRWKKLGCN